MMRAVAGQIVFSVRGVTVRYAPSQGDSWHYTTSCPHGEVVRARTQVSAKDDARHAGDWCVECKAEGQPTYPEGTW